MKADDLKKALSYSDVSKLKLAEKLDVNYNNLWKKIERETLKDDDLKKIAKAIGAEYKEYFEFPDGTKIGIK